MIFRMYYKKAGGHVHCRMFSGRGGSSLGKCGDIVFRQEDFDALVVSAASDAIEFIEEKE